MKKIKIFYRTIKDIDFNVRIDENVFKNISQLMDEKKAKFIKHFVEYYNFPTPFSLDKDIKDGQAGIMECENEKK